MRTTLQHALETLGDFRKLRVLVVGDFFLDEYVEGEMFEISREGPIPVIRLESRTRTPGAAGNLAASVRSLGARVRVIGVIGDDENGRALASGLEAEGVDPAGLLRAERERTFTYTKIRARVDRAPSRELLRIDILPEGPLPTALEEEVVRGISKAAAEVDGILVLDQIDHLVTPRVLAELPAIAKRHGCLLHGSSRERMSELRGFDLVIPNDVEARVALGADAVRLSVEELGEELRRRGGHRQVIVTLGPDGMAVFPGEGTPAPVRVPTAADEVVDVTGAGDAVASTAILGNLSGWPLETTARVASLSAAIAVGHPGTHHVSRSELEERLRTAGG